MGSSYTFDNLFNGKRPDGIAVAIVADGEATGIYSANTLKFHNFGLNYIEGLGLLAPEPPHPSRNQLHHKRLFQGISAGDGGYRIGQCSLHLGNNGDSVGKRFQHPGVLSDTTTDRWTPLEAAERGHSPGDED